MCTIISTFSILPPQTKKTAHRAVPYQNRSSLARQRNLLFIALFCLLFQRYASALLLSTALRKFIKATKSGFFFCIKNRPGFLSQKPGRSYTLFVLSQALTQNLAGGLDRSRGRVPKLQSVRSNDDTLFVNFQCVLPHLRNDLLQIFFLQIEFRQFCLVI